MCMEKICKFLLFMQVADRTNQIFSLKARAIVHHWYKHRKSLHNLQSMTVALQASALPALETQNLTSRTTFGYVIHSLYNTAETANG